MSDTTTPPQSTAAATSPNAQKFAELVEVRMKSRGFLTNEEEMALLERGIADFRLSLADARGVVHSVAHRLDVGLERGFERTMEQWMIAVAGRRKRLSRHQFNHAALVYHRQANGKMDLPAVRKRCKIMMEELSLEPRRAGLLRTRRWYYRI